MKKTDTNFTKVTIVMLIITMLALIALSGTYAKYTTTVSNEGSVVVAQWNFGGEINGSMDESATFNLADTMTKSIDAENLSAGVVAPGTEGDFQVMMYSESEVATEYVLTITPHQDSGELPENLVFNITDSNGNTTPLELIPAGTDAEAIPAYKLDGVLSAGDSIEETLTIDWEWPYESGNDEADTIAGYDAHTLVFDVSITGTQVAI